MTTGTELLAIGILILCNAFFVAAEIALVTVRRSRLQQLIEEGNAGAVRVHRLVDRPERLLAVIQTGITFVSFLAAAFAGASLSDELAALLRPYIDGSAELVAIIVVTGVLSLVTIVFGELVPKTLALAHAERYALVMARPIDLIGRLLAPIVKLLTVSTTVITRMLGVSEIDRDRLTADELMILVERGGEQGIIEAEEEQMIGAVLELGQRRVHEVMVPRIDIVGLPDSASLDEVVDTIVREGHSRIPVYEGSVDRIFGILYAKDLLPYLKGEDDPPALWALVRNPLFVPESMLVDDLLHQLQRRRVHIAVVLDEYGGTAGLITIEDLIEQIVGEIQDEYDEEEPIVAPTGPDEARVDGRAPVDAIAEHFELDIEFEDRDQYDTIGGLIYHRIGGVPRVGDRIVVDDRLALTVESTVARRVAKVRAQRLRPEDGDGRGEGSAGG